MKLVFILSIFLMLSFQLLKIVKADEVLVVVGGKLERGKLSNKKDGYVIVENKVVRGKLLKQGAWLRNSRRDDFSRKEFPGIYYLVDMWKEGSGFFIATKYRKYDYISFNYISPTSTRKDRWRVVKN